MRSASVTLGEREYKIVELRSRDNSAWRKEFRETLAPVLELLGIAATTELPTSMAEAQESKNNLAPVFSALQRVAGVMLESIDDVKDMVFSYSPALRKDRERIEENAFDSELVEAFTSILGLAFPFGALAAGLRRFTASGTQTTQQPSQN